MVAAKAVAGSNFSSAAGQALSVELDFLHSAGQTARYEIQSGDPSAC